MTYWGEIAKASEFLAARTFEFDYFLNVQDQTVYLDIEFKARKLKDLSIQNAPKGK